MLSPERKQELRSLINSAMHSASATLSSPSPSTPLSRIEQYWRSKTVPQRKTNSGRKKRPHTAASSRSRTKAKGRPAPPSRSRMVDDALLDSDVAWSRTLDRSIGFEQDIQRSHVSESQRRALRHQRQTDDLHNSMRNEKMSLKRAKKAARLKRLKRAQSDNMATLLPDDRTTGGLEGRELKSWKIIMKRHAEVVSTANVRVSSKLERHVEHRRQHLKQQSQERFQNATANDGGMSGNQLKWWKRQRELHDRVVNGAQVKIDTVHEKHVLDEWKRKKEQRVEEEKTFDVNDGGLHGPEKMHWRIMRDRHDELIADATKTIDTTLSKHVLEYREALEKKKKGPDGVVECGLSGRELKNWKLFQKVHDNIIKTATNREDTKLAPHAARYREERMEKSKKRFENYDVSSGGLEGPELKLWHHMRATHDQVVKNARLRVNVQLPKHVQHEWDRKKIKRKEKWSNYDPDVNGGKHGVELEHWKIMHALHDKLIATAKPTTKTTLDKHVKEYQEHLHKKHIEKWSEKDNAGLSGRELKWWREQLEIYNELKNNAVSTMVGKGTHGEGDMELPKHVQDYRIYLQKQRKTKEKDRTINDGMLGGPDLEHWKIMRKIHDELIETATKSIDVKHEKHVRHHMDYVKQRNLKRWDPKHGFTAGLEGPELHHWHEMTKLHERVVSSAQPQVDCHRVKSVAELVMEKRHFEKWGTVPHTSTVGKKKKKKKKKKQKSLRDMARAADAPASPKVLTEAEYNRALEIAAVVQKEIYDKELKQMESAAAATTGDDGGGGGGDGDGDADVLPTWNGIRALKSTSSPTSSQGDTSFTRRRLQAALKRAAFSAASPSARVVKGSPIMLSPPKGRHPEQRQFDFGRDPSTSELTDTVYDHLLRPLLPEGVTTVLSFTT